MPRISFRRPRVAYQWQHKALWVLIWDNSHIVGKTSPQATIISDLLSFLSEFTRCRCVPWAHSMPLSFTPWCCLTWNHSPASDDLCISPCPETQSTLFVHLKLIFEKCRIYRIYLNMEICVLMVRQGKILGHIVSCNGISMDFKKIQILMELLRPQNVKEV